MKTKQVLDIDKMKHLKELGVDTSKASMCHVKFDGENEFSNLLPNNQELFERLLVVKYIPAFTLQDILDLLPKKLQHRYEDYEMTIFYSHEYYDWKVQYLNDNVSFMDYKSGEELVDASYEMLCWCVENGYVETNK